MIAGRWGQLVTLMGGLSMLGATPASAGEHARHGQVQVRLHASTGSPNDAPNSVADFSLSYQAGVSTRMRITRVRLWVGDTPQVVRFTLKHNGDDIGRRAFVANGSGSVRIFASSLGVPPTEANRIEVIVRFAGERFALRANVQRDQGPFNPGTRPDSPGMSGGVRPAPNAEISVQVLRTGIFPRAEIERRLRALRRRWRACEENVGNLRRPIILEATVDPSGRIREVETRGATGRAAVLVACITRRLRRLLTLPVVEDNQALVKVIFRFNLRARH